MSDHDIISQKERLHRILNRLKLVITIAGFIYAALFIVLKIEKFSFFSFVNDRLAYELVNIALLLYYYCWARGSISDASCLHDVLIESPNQGRIPVTGYVFIGALILFGVLLFLIREYTIFLALLLAFWLINIVSFVYLLMVIVDPPMKRSEQFYRSENREFSLLRLARVRNFNFGAFQAVRFAVGATLLIGLNVVAHSSIGVGLAAWLGFESLEFFYALAICLFIVFVETWIWLERLKRGQYLRMVDDIEEDYLLSRRV